MKPCTSLLISVALLALLAVPAYAVSPTDDPALQVALDDNPCYAWRYVMDSGDDFLVLCRYEAAPLEESDHQADFTGVTVDGAGDVEPLVLNNRVIRDNTNLADDLTVTADGTTDITADCELALDLITLTCTNTGLSAATHDFEVVYRTGWDAYNNAAIIFRLLDGTTTVSIRTAPQTGYALVGIYLTAQEFSDAGLTWGDGGITVNLAGNPSLWSTPATYTSTISWSDASNHAGTQSALGNRLVQQLQQIQSSAGLAQGTYVVSSGITPAGQLIAQNAFGAIMNAVPTVFQTTQFNPSIPYTPQPKGLINQINAATAASAIGQAWHGRLYGTIFFGILGVVAAAFAAWFTRQKGAVFTALSVFLGWAIIFGGWLVGAVAEQFPWISGMGFTAMALIIIIRKVNQ